MNPVSLDLPSRTDLEAVGAVKLITSLAALRDAVNGLVAVAGSIQTPPDAQFAVTRPTATAVHLDASASTTVNGTLKSYAWDFGDGTTGIGKMIDHTYATTGNYPITLTITDGAGLTDSFSQTVTVMTQSGPTQPSGTGISQIQDLAGGTFNAKINAAPTSNSVSLPSGTFTFNDFGTSTYYGATYAGQALLGSGLSYSTIQMNAGTSTKSGTTNVNGINPLYYVAFKSSTRTIDGVTFRATNQGHVYGGARIDSSTNTTLSNSRFVGFPGNNQSPPGETFAFNFNHCTNPKVNNVEFDGAGVAASLLATNSCAGIVIDGMYAHDTLGTGHQAAQGACKGFALWQQTGGGTISRYKGRNNWAEFGFERCTGTFNIYDPDTAGSKLFAHLGNDGYSAPCTINIYFTAASGLMPAALPFWCPSTYMGKTNTQSVASHVNVYLDGNLQSGVARSVGYPS